MRFRASTLAIAMLLAGCGSSDDVPPPPEPAAPGAPPPVVPPPPMAAAEELRRKAVEQDPGVYVPPGGLQPFGQRTDPNPDRGSWMQQLEPTNTGNCRFTARPAADRPADLDLLAWSGNMDLYGQGNILAHDHAIGFVEAGWLTDRPVIAARQGMDDLWIEPLAPWEDVTLIIGGSELYCHRREG